MSIIKEKILFLSKYCDNDIFKYFNFYKSKMILSGEQYSLSLFNIIPKMFKIARHNT